MPNIDSDCIFSKYQFGRRARYESRGKELLDRAMAYWRYCRSYGYIYCQLGKDLSYVDWKKGIIHLESAAGVLARYRFDRNCPDKRLTRLGD